MAFIALQQDKDDQAQAALQDATDGGSKNARAWLQLGIFKSDADLLKKASELNPRWGEPYYQLADLNAAIEKPQLEERATLLKKATALNPRNSDYWTALAKTYEAAKDFGEAQKAWSGAERTAATDPERERLRKVRLEVQEKRFDYERSERKRVHDDEAADLARVKAQSDAEIHAAETAARKKMNPNGEAPPKPVAWYEDTDKNPSVQGVFQRLECLSQGARLVIQTADGKTVQLLMSDPSQVTTGGTGDHTFSCGPQKSPRQVVVRYTAKPDAKLHTEGVVTTIEFH
jgi:tetratricopeptide (TPR) repeat protein